MIEFGRRSVCKKRYGRATLTIRGWGAWTELLNSGLAQIIDAYRDARVNAEEVSWAFVRARVVAHSPTFDWATADLTRLIRLVVECSDDPPLKADSPEALAAELVKAQDQDREQLERLGRVLRQQFQPTLDAVNQLSRAITPQLRFFDQQRQAIEAISRATWTPALDHLAVLSRSMAAIEPPPLIKLAATQWSAVSEKVNLLSASIRLPDLATVEIGRSFAATARAYQAAAIPPALEQLFGRQTFRISDVFTAAHATAAFIADEGDTDEAEVLEAITVEAEEALQAPSLESIQEALHNLTETVRKNEERRQRDQDSDRTLNLLLWFVALYVAVYLALMPYLVRP